MLSEGDLGQILQAWLKNLGIYPEGSRKQMPAFQMEGETAELGLCFISSLWRSFEKMEQSKGGVRETG